MANIKEYTKKNGSKAYMFNFYIGVDPITGKKKRTTRRGFKTKREAHLALAQLRLKVNEDGAGSIHDMTYKEVYDLWIKQHKLDVKLTTYDIKLSKFKRILSKFGHLKMDKITTLYCQQVVNEWAVELDSFNDYKIQANLVFKYAMKYELIQKNPMEYVTIPKMQSELIFDEDEELVNFFTKKELKRFLNKAKVDMSIKDYTLFRLLAFTGLRKGEALGLHWSDIDIKKRSLIVRKTLATRKGNQLLQPPKTANSRRLIDVDENTLAILQVWKSTQKEEYTNLGLIYKADEQPVFTRFDKVDNKMKYLRLASPNDTLARFFKKHLAFPKITVHGFRHTHASLLFEAGATVKAVQEQLGHKDIQTTMNVYTHVTDTVKEKTTKLLHDYVGF